MKLVLLGVAAFLLSIVEEAIAVRRTQAITAKRAVAAANVSALFDAILFVDVLLVAAGYWWTIFPIVAGSWCGNYWAVRWGPKPKARRRRPVSKGSSRWKPPRQARG